MIVSSEVRMLRGASAEDLVSEFSGYTQIQFGRDHAVPVVIAARNEAHDLPATLLSLAKSELPVLPIVVENGSNDATGEYASEMGAITLKSPVAAKMAALQLGVNYVRAELNSNLMLFTDADTLVSRHWSDAMTSILVGARKSPAIVCGMGIFMHGNKVRVDAARSAYTLARDSVKGVLGGRPTANGFNIGILFDEDGQMAEQYQNLAPDLFIGEDAAIADKCLAIGGVILRSNHLSSVVVTRGDRYKSLRDCFDARQRQKRARFYPDYGEFQVYEAGQV